MNSENINVFNLLEMDTHTLERSSQRGNFVDAEEFLTYLSYQASKKVAPIKILRWFRLQALKLRKGQKLTLALKWEGFLIPPVNPEDDDIETDAIFFVGGDENGIRLDTMLFYPRATGGRKNVYLGEGDIKYIATIDDRVKKWEGGWKIKK